MVSIPGLDPPLTSLIGRKQDLEDVGQLLQESRLVTIVGPTGMGKTRLAQAAAVELWPEYGHGVAFVDLTDAPPVELLPRIIGGLLSPRLNDNSTLSGTEALLNQLANLKPDKRLLLVLDNCEDFAPTVGELCMQILKRAATVRILATSRYLLGVPDEQLYLVPPLELPDALQLVVERAQRRIKGFTLTEANRAELTALCRDLDCVPVSLEIAAARLHVYDNPEDLRPEVDTLGGQPAPTVGRRRTGHESVAAMVQATWLDSSAEQRDVWMRVSQLVGQWDIRAGVAVGTSSLVPAELVPTVLSDLVVRGIIRNDDPGTGMRMLETFRRAGQRFAEQSGHDGLIEEARRRRAEHFGNRVIGLVQHYYTARELSALREIGKNLPNIRAALLTCATTRSLRRLGLQMATTLAGLLAWWWVGSLWEGDDWLAKMIAANPDPSALRATALALQGFFRTCRGDHDEAELLLQQARSVLADPLVAAQDTPGDRAYSAAVLAGTYGAHRWLSGHSDSVDLLLDASAEMANLGLDGLRYFFCNLAVYSGVRHRPDRREEWLRLAQWLLADSRAHGDPAMNGAWASATAGLTQLLYGNPTDAVELLRGALRRELEDGDQWAPGLVGLQYAEALAVVGDVDTAAIVLAASELLVDLAGMDLQRMPPLLAGALRARELVTEQLRGRPWPVLSDDDAADPEATLRAIVIPPPQAPSDRELEVVSLLARPGRQRYADIAAELGLSVKTVQTYVDRLKGKLGLRTADQLVGWYKRQQSAQR